MESQPPIATEVLAALPIGVWLLTADGQTRYRNPASRRLAPAIDSLAELAAAMVGVPLVSYARRVGAGGPAVDEPAVLLRSGTVSRMVQLRLAAGPPSLPGSVVITLEEVSARLRVERLRALAETTIAVCHEINNPLAILSGEIALWRRDGGAPAARLGALESAVDRIAAVLRRLKRAAEPLGSDYLPSRGVSMLDLGAAAEDGGRRRPGPGGAPGTRPEAA